MIMASQKSLSPDEEDLIFLYVESKAEQRPVARVVELQVEKLLAESQAARDLVDQTNSDREYVNNQFDVEVDCSDHARLADWIDNFPMADSTLAESHSTSEPEPEVKVIPFRRFIPEAPQYSHFALAASVTALLLSNFVWLHFYFDKVGETNTLELQLAAVSERAGKRGERLQLAEADARKWAAAAEDARYAGDRAAAELADAQYDIANLQIKQVELQDQFADLADESAGLVQTEAELQQAKADRERLRAQIDDLAGEVANKQQALASLESESGADALRLASLQAELTESKSWIRQVAQYHRVHASAPRERLVEATADEKDDIEKWLGDMIGRELTVPDLSSLGMTFAGGRLLSANGMPVAQIAYLDQNDRLLALCIMPLEKAVKEPSEKQDDDLTLVDWRDGRHAYLLVGWTEPGLMMAVTEEVRPYYEL